VNPQTFARAIVSIERKYGLRLDARSVWLRMDVKCGKGWEGTKPKCRRAKPKPDKQGTENDFGDFDFFADIPSTQSTPKPKEKTPVFSFGKLTSAEKIGAREFSGSYVNGGDRGDFGKRIFDNAKKVAGLSEDEAAGLASWLSNGYRDMGKVLREGKIRYDVPGGEDGVRGSLKNADSALRKIPPATIARLKERGQPTGKPLSRFIEVDKPSEFIQKYKDSIGKDFTEPGFFGTSAQSGDSETMKLYSTRANVIYKINANLSGKGQGRYVDDLKGWPEDYEGEVLYPSNSKFRVKSVGNALSKDESKEFEEFEKAGGRRAAIKSGAKAYTRYQALSKKANTYTIELDEK
jgi:ADP-ribosyltransferase exoenzyme